MVEGPDGYEGWWGQALGADHLQRLHGRHLLLGDGLRRHVLDAIAAELMRADDLFQRIQVALNHLGRPWILVGSRSAVNLRIAACHACIFGTLPEGLMASLWDAA